MRRIIVYSILGLLLGVLVGVVSGYRFVEMVALIHDSRQFPELVFSGDPPLPLPSLESLAAGAQTDAQALSQIAAFVNTNQDMLGEVFDEPNMTRAKALYALYAVHVSHVYGVHPPDDGFLAWLADEVAECGSYADALESIFTELEIPSRRIVISGGTHQWMEAEIDGRWELFDATVNLWANTSGFEMERGAARVVRYFYTPMLDPAYGEQYQPGMRLSAQELRDDMGHLGAGWYPKAYLWVME